MRWRLGDLTWRRQEWFWATRNSASGIKAGTPELQCKTYEEFECLLEAAADSVGGTICTLPKVPGFFCTVPKRVKGDPTLPMMRRCSRPYPNRSKPASGIAP